MTTLTAQRPTGADITQKSYVVSDAITMLRRNLLHVIRYPGLSMFTILGPVVILLLFVFVFGGTLGAGLPGVDPAGGRDPLDRSSRRAEPDQQADSQHEGHGDERLDGVAEHVPGEHRRP